jgi:type IV secretion system protein VirB8
MTERYFDEAQTWDHDLYRELERSRRRAWIVAATSGLLAVLAMVALVGLLPLKETVPYVITKDRETGYVEVARAAGPALTSDEALSEFSVMRYVTARETYDPGDLQSNYDLVYATSSPEAWESYAPLYRKNAPGSLMDQYGRLTSVRVAIKNVSFLAADQAFVRFSTTRTSGSQATTEHWASTVRFRYAAPATDLRGRAKNPLGFEVVSYRRDQEVVGGS